MERLRTRDPCFSLCLRVGVFSTPPQELVTRSPFCMQQPLFRLIWMALNRKLMRNCCQAGQFGAVVLFGVFACSPLAQRFGFDLQLSGVHVASLASWHGRAGRSAKRADANLTRLLTPATRRTPQACCACWAVTLVFWNFCKQSRRRAYMDAYAAFVPLRRAGFCSRGALP